MGKAAIFIIVFGGMLAWLTLWFFKGEAYLLDLMTESARQQYQQRSLNARFQSVLRTKPRFSRLKEAGWEISVPDQGPTDQPFSFRLQKNHPSFVLTDCRLIPKSEGCLCGGITFNSGKKEGIPKPYPIAVRVPSEDATTIDLQFSRHGSVSLKPEAEKKWHNLPLKEQLNLLATSSGAFDTLAGNGWHIAVNDLQKSKSRLQPLFSLQKNQLLVNQCSLKKRAGEVACDQIQWGNSRLPLPIHMSDLNLGIFFTPWERPFTAFLTPQAKTRFVSFETHLRFWLVGAYLPQLKKMVTTWNPRVTGFNEKGRMIIGELTLGETQLNSCLLDLSGTIKTAQCESLRYHVSKDGNTVQREIKTPLRVPNLGQGQAVSGPNTDLQLEKRESFQVSGTLKINSREIKVENPQLTLLSPQEIAQQRTVLDLQPFSLTRASQVQTRQDWSFNWLSQWHAYVRDYLDFNGSAAQLTVRLVLDLEKPETGFSLQGSGKFFGQEPVPVQGTYRPGEALALNLEKLQLSSGTGEICSELEPAWIEQDFTARRLRVMGTTTVEDKTDLFCEDRSGQRPKFAERIGKKLLYGTLLKKARRELSSGNRLSLGVHLLFDPGNGVFCSRLAARGKAMLDITTGNAVPFQMTAPYQWQTQDRDWQASPDTLKSFVKHALAKGMHFPEVNFHQSHGIDPGPVTTNWRVAVPSHTLGPAK